MSTQKPVIVRNRVELTAALASRGDVALVPTMGALHEGHAALMRQARILAPTLVVSIFVNPTQFGPGEDFESYPRTPDLDLSVCEREGVDVVFMPERDVMYPGGLNDTVFVDPGHLGTILEGVARPTHFRGVLTVVAKLFAQIRPRVAVFGEKDFQQLALIRRMVRDLMLDVEIVGHEIVREPEGLAMSSRNAYLDSDQRRQALVLSRAMMQGAAAGPLGAEAVLESAKRAFAAEPDVRLDYLVLTDRLLGPLPPDFRGEARLITAAIVGSTRLLDNYPVTIGQPEG